MTAGFVEFEFDLPDALLASLIGILDKMDAAPLSPADVADIPEAQGVYLLLLRSGITYVGKTDGDAGLRQRLERHAWTIQHRLGLSVPDVAFKAVRIFVFTAMDLETQLIRHYAPVPWNNSGFGSNDPGRNRDTTDLRPEGFDAQFPIDLDHPVSPAISAGMSAAEVLAALRRELPYTLRAELAKRGGKAPHADISAAIVGMLPTELLTTRKVIESVVKSLPPGWQATALAGRIVLYREERDYPFGTVIARSPST